MITLLDYGAGNVRSVINAIESLGETVNVVTSGGDILAAEKLVFPGVGAFGNMMRILREKKYIEPLTTYLRADRPFLGICLGLQVLFDYSQEAPDVRGLGFIAGAVKRFAIDLSVPHIGWNGLNFKQSSRIFAGLQENEKFYFVHSYHVVSDDPGVVLTTTDYGCEFVSSIQKGNVIATQFHPEKSGRAGLRLLQNFLESTAEAVRPAQSAARRRWPNGSSPAWMCAQTIRATWWSPRVTDTMSGKTGMSETSAGRWNWRDGITRKAPMRSPFLTLPVSGTFPWRICRCWRY